MIRNNHSKKITSLIDAFAQQQPEHIAVYFGNRKWTYSDLVSDVSQKAEQIKTLGVRPGMGVGVIGQNNYEFITSMLAVMQVGAVTLPISHNLKSDEVLEIIHRTKLHFIWAEQDSQLPGDFLPSTVKLPSGYLWFTSPKATTHGVAPHVDGAALIRFTSGTTGKSKGVILSHQSIIERTACANKALALGKNDTVIWVLSMAYHFVVSILMYLRYGCSICICEQFLADEIIERTNTLGGTFLYVSPMHIRMLNREGSGHQMPTLDRVISTSMAIDSNVCTAFYKKFNLPITQAFGIIEIGLPIINLQSAGREPGAIGLPLTDYHVVILSEEGIELGVEEVGQLAINGPGMFDAYLDPPMMREEALKFGYFFTGDLATKSKDGTITIVGRSKNVINVAGNKAFPEEVEAVLNRHPDVVISRAKGFQHPLLNECVMAEVVLQVGKHIDVETLITYCRKRLATYKVPQKIIFVEELPKTDSGKILRVHS